MTAITPSARRLVSACVLALLAAVPLAAVTGAANPPQWGERLDRQHQEGEAVRIAFNARDPENETVTYGSASLPRGLSIDASTGLVTGVLTPSDPDTTNGAAGIHTVVIRATDADGEVADYTFTWRVSRFRKGDVFAGIGMGKYQVFGEDGVYKYTVTSETEQEWTNAGYGGGGTTTGCGYNWVSRKMYFTAFDVNHAPAVIEVDPVPASGAEAFPRTRISTFRDSGVSDPSDPSLRLSIDNGPESVAFDAQGNMFVGHASGFYNTDWLPADSNGRPVATFGDNPDDWNIYYAKAGGGLILSNGLPIPYAQGVSVEGFLEKSPGVLWPVTGNTKPLDHWGRDVQKFQYSGATGEMSRTASFDVHAGWQGSDWIDLSTDQRTLFYTSEYGVIYRYDTGPGVPDGSRQLAPFATLPQGRGIVNTLYAIRILPPGDGSGGVIVAGPAGLLRIAADGRIVNYFDVPGEDAFFAVTLSPDGRTLWSASMSSGRVYRWDVASGRALGPGIQTQAFDYGNGVKSLTGLCMMGEYTAAQEVCGNNLDDDGDGEIDELCQGVEACFVDSPGDDDGDGLVDANDPDCGASNLCAADGPTDPSVAGFCSRLSTEGDSVQVRPAPVPSGQAETYQVTGLPPGISAGANGWLTGTPQHSIVQNGVTPDTQDFLVTVNATRTRVSTGQVMATYQHEFTWTIRNLNQLPVATADAITMPAGQSRTIDVRLNDYDLDTEDTLSLTGFTQPSNGTVTVSGTTFTYIPSAVFAGTDNWTYTLADGRGGSATATVTATVVNRAPIAIADSATAAGTRPAIVNVLANDSDPDNHAITISSVSTPSNGTAVVNANGTITYIANAGFEGTDSFSYTIRDAFGAESSATVTVVVGPASRIDPCMCASARASIGLIWPANHRRLIDVNVTNVTDANGGGVQIKVLGIYQDEPTNYLGDGTTTIDAGGVGTDTAWLRAERTGNRNAGDNGRLYEIVFEATASDGSSCQGSVFTGVPHDQGQGRYVVDDGVRYDSTVPGGPIVRTGPRIERRLPDLGYPNPGAEACRVDALPLASTFTDASPFIDPRARYAREPR